MNISSTSLFHFTSKFDTLVAILESDFMCQYSTEKFLGIVTNDQIPDLNKGVLMVCFCDIPLSNIDRHIEIYGSYSIGLTKDWAFKKKINPVIYCYPNSDISDAMFNLSRKLIKAESVEESHINFHHFANIIQYVKPYSGDFVKSGKVYNSVRFYNEREWRYIPKLKALPQNSWLKINENNEDQLVEINKYILEKEFEQTKLKFNAEDIKYIIVKTEEEIPKMIETLSSMKTNKYSAKEIQFLMTKITSIEQISADF